MFIPDELFTCGVLPANDLTNKRSFSYRLSRGKRSSVISCVCEKPKPQPFVFTLRYHLPCFLTQVVWDRHALSRADVVQCLNAYVSWHLWSLILIENGHIANPALKSSRASTDAVIPGGKVLALKRICGFIDKQKPSSDGDAQAVACPTCKFVPSLKTRTAQQSVMNRPGDIHIPKLPSHSVSFDMFEKMRAQLVIKTKQRNHYADDSSSGSSGSGGSSSDSDGCASPLQECLITNMVFAWSDISFVVLQEEKHLSISYLLCSRVVRLSEYTEALSGRLKHRMKPILVTFQTEVLAILEESFWIKAQDEHQPLEDRGKNQQEEEEVQSNKTTVDSDGDNVVKFINFDLPERVDQADKDESQVHLHNEQQPINEITTSDLHCERENQHHSEAPRDDEAHDELQERQNSDDGDCQQIHLQQQCLPPPSSVVVQTTQLIESLFIQEIITMPSKPPPQHQQNVVWLKFMKPDTITLKKQRKRKRCVLH